MLPHQVCTLLRMFAVSVLSSALSILPFAAAASGESQGTPSSSIVPSRVKFSGTVKDAQGKPLSGTVGITFSFYKDQQGGAPLWQETQNVTLDASGRYTVQLGSSLASGLPLDLFASGEARWLGVQTDAQPEQPRVLLLSVPYALKAADAETIGGLPPSAFVLATPPSSPGTSAASGAASAAPQSSAAPATVGGSGTTNFIPLWTDSADLGNSILFQLGTGSTAKIGVNTITPAATLDVKGGSTIRGTLNLPAQGTATVTKGFNSQPISMVGSAFSSTTSKVVNQTFAWQTQPAGNNTTSPSGALELLYASGTNPLANTGLSIGNTGLITFAGGQTFPGTGTITGVTTASGSGLSGGGTSGSLSLGLLNTCATNQVLQWNGSAWACSTAGTLTGVTAGTALTGGGGSGNVTLNVDTTKVVTGIAAGTDLTGGGTGGVQTLSLDTTKVPQLNVANTFTGNQTVNGNLTATGAVTAATYDIGGSLFAFGTYAQENAFLGFAGSTTTTGTFNTGVGISSLFSNTTGSNNTATGAFALAINNSGGSNTATGQQALYSNTAGSSNTANGATALLANTTGNNNTATGYQSLFFNSTGFANTANGNQALLNTTTGDSNTATGQQALYSNTTGEGNTGNGTIAVYSNSTGLANTGEGARALYYAVGSFNTALGYAAGPDQTTPGLSNSTAIGAFADVSVSNAMVLGSINGVNSATADTLVGIGTTAPAYLLHIGNRGLTNNFLRVEGPLHSGSGGLAASFGGWGDFGIDASGTVNGRFVVKESGNVGVGVSAPTHIFQVGQSKGAAFADSWSTYSSRRWKTNIRTLPNALAKVEQLRGVSYEMKDSGKHEIGVIAEEVGEVVPEVVSFEANGKDAQGVDYSRLTAVLIEAVKQQQRQIREQQRQIARLNGKVGVLEDSLRTASQAAKSSAVAQSAKRTHALRSDKTEVVRQPGN